MNGSWQQCLTNSVLTVASLIHNKTSKMMLLRNFIFALTLSKVVNGEEDYNKVVYENGMVFHEDFYNALTVSSTETSHGFLRRELQTPVTCRANNSGNVYVCGRAGGGSSDPCRDSTATCDGLTHSCTCTGSSDTSCSYCRIRTANSILCQVTGSTTTFVDPTFKIVTCSCEYLGNNQVRQNCFEPVPSPIPLPTLPVPVAVRTPVGSVPVPSVGIPVPAQPVQPQFSLTAPAPVQPPPPVQVPVETRVAPNPEITCRAVDSFNLSLGFGASCDAMPNYPCTCTGSTETSCTYCRVQTFNAVRCQVTGSDVTFLDPTGALTTCLCEYRGNGQAQQFCYQEPVANAVVRAPSPPRAPSGSFDD